MVPVSGAIRADVALDASPLPIGKTSLTIGTLTISVSVLRSDFDDAGRPRAVVIGGLGWQNMIPSPISFQSAGGVRLATVLDALARGAGETIDKASFIDKTIGD